MSIRQRAGTAARALLPVAALAAMAACGSDSVTGPANIDLTAVQTASTQVGSIVSQPAMISLFAGLYGDGGFVSPAPTRLANLVATTAKIGDVRNTVTAHRAIRNTSNALRALAPSGRLNFTYDAALINDTLKGKTFVRVVGANGPQWQQDPNQHAAPANGVRFVLVNFDTTSHTFGSTVVGYLDVRDSSVNPVNRISAIVSTPTGRVVLKSHFAETGDQTRNIDTLSGVITNEQNQSVNYSAVETETGSNTNSPRWTEDLSASLSTGAMSVNASSADGNLTANDKSTVTGKIGDLEISIVTGTVSDHMGGYTQSDTTKISANNAPYGYAVYRQTPNGSTIDFFDPSGSKMSDAKVAALMKFFGAVDSLFSAAFVGFMVLSFLYTI